MIETNIVRVAQNEFLKRSAFSKEQPKQNEKNARECEI
jgi:hypothetical protein